MTPPEHLVLVGSYASADEEGIHAFAFDPIDGALTPAGSWSGVTNPSFLAVGGDGAVVFTVAETSPGRVHALALDRSSGVPQLTAGDHGSSGGDHPCHLSTSHDGRWLAVSNYSSGTVAVLSIAGEGGLGPTTALQEHEGSGPDSSRQDAPHAHSAVFDRHDRFLVAADLGADRLVVSPFDPADGTVGGRRDVATEPGAGPRHTAFLPDGGHLVCANELDSTLGLYRYDAATGELLPGPRQSTIATPDAANLVAGVQVSDDGRHVYVSNRGDDSIAAFTLDPDTGLRRTAIRPCGGTWPRAITLAPGGRHLVVANERSDEVVVLPLQGAGADLGPPVARVAVHAPTCAVFV